VVSGGITLAEAPDYLRQGCAAVCVGKAIIDAEAAARGDVQAVARFADAALAKIGHITCI
jgi:2-keto-3-deoxy-6-phosphogluconate aldolase